MPARPILRLMNAGFGLFLCFAVLNGFGNFVTSATKYSYWVVAGFVIVLWLARSATNKYLGTPLLPLIRKCKLERPVSWTQALLRNTWILVALLPTIGLPLMVVVGLVLFGSMWLRSDRRGFHDLLADTTVVRA